METGGRRAAVVVGGDEWRPAGWRIAGGDGEIAGRRGVNRTVQEAGIGYSDHYSK